MSLSGENNRMAKILSIDKNNSCNRPISIEKITIDININLIDKNGNKIEIFSFEPDMIDTWV